MRAAPTPLLRSPSADPIATARMPIVTEKAATPSLAPNAHFSQANETIDPIA